MVTNGTQGEPGNVGNGGKTNGTQGEPGNVWLMVVKPMGHRESLGMCG